MGSPEQKQSRVISARVIKWDEDSFGVAVDYADHQHSAYVVGTKEQALAEAVEIRADARSLCCGACPECETISGAPSDPLGSGQWDEHKIMPEHRRCSFLVRQDQHRSSALANSARALLPASRPARTNRAPNEQGIRLSLENAPAIEPTPRRTKYVIGVWIFYVESRARTRGKRIVPSWKTSTASRRGARRWRSKSYHKSEHEADRAKRCESAYRYRRDHQIGSQIRSNNLMFH
jgi:hypothetical protein